MHPTQKPVALMEYLVKTYTNEGATVLDNCMGSGSTGVACVNTRRNFIGIEKDGAYFAIAKARIESAKESAIA
jgi:site-specific DNA-methyltransferase (adenine-specific)